MKKTQYEQLAEAKVYCQKYADQYSFFFDDYNVIIQPKFNPHYSKKIRFEQSYRKWYVYDLIEKRPFHRSRKRITYYRYVSLKKVIDLTIEYINNRRDELIEQYKKEKEKEKRYRLLEKTYPEMKFDTVSGHTNLKEPNEKMTYISFKEERETCSFTIREVNYAELIEINKILSKGLPEREVVEEFDEGAFDIIN